MYYSEALKALAEISSEGLPTLVSEFSVAESVGKLDDGRKFVMDFGCGTARIANWLLARSQATRRD